VPELVIRERPPSVLRNINGGPREMPELKIRERPPSTLRNVDDGRLGDPGAENPGAPTINSKKRQQREDLGAPTINAKKRQRRAP
jgi:hypothetical protein